MNLVALRAAYKYWRARENFFYRKWLVARYHANPKQSPAWIHKERARWWTQFEGARQRRHHYEIEIAKRLAHVQGEEVSMRGVRLIANFEGYSGNVYNDGTGVMTVGYGHIENVPGNGWWVPGQKKAYYLTEQEAMNLLKIDLNKHYAPAVRALHLPLNQNQFDALVSFVYNCGVGAIGNTEVGRYLRSYQFKAAANALLGWDHAGGRRLEGLTRRREAERSLFLS